MNVLVIGATDFDEYGYLKGMLQTLYTIEGTDIDPEIEWSTIGGASNGLRKVLERWCVNNDHQVTYLQEGITITDLLTDIDELVVFGKLTGTTKEIISDALDWNMPVHRFSTEEVRKPKEKKDVGFTQYHQHWEIDDPRYQVPFPFPGSDQEKSARQMDRQRGLSGSQREADMAREVSDRMRAAQMEHMQRMQMEAMDHAGRNIAEAADRSMVNRAMDMMKGKGFIT
jgi:hypothetical protein